MGIARTSKRSLKMNIEEEIAVQRKIKLHLQARGFGEEAEYFELILAIQETIEEIMKGKNNEKEND